MHDEFLVNVFVSYTFVSYTPIFKETHEVMQSVIQNFAWYKVSYYFFQWRRVAYSKVQYKTSFHPSIVNRPYSRRPWDLLDPYLTPVAFTCPLPAPWRLPDLPALKKYQKYEFNWL